MLTRFVAVCGWFPCNDACLLSTLAAVVRVVDGRSLGGRVVKHGSMFTVIRCVRLCEARLWRVGHVRIGVRSLITFERGRITLRELYCTWSRRAVEAKEHHFLSVNRSRSSCGSPCVTQQRQLSQGYV